MRTQVIHDTTDHISEEAVSNSATSVIPERSILIVVRSGVLAHHVPIALTGRALAFNQDLKALIPDEARVIPDYIAYFLRATEAQILEQGVKKGATVHSLRSGFIENLQMPLPPILEQRCIIDILSRVEGIVRLQRQAAEKTRKIIPALFLDMFGDPATNPKGWPTSTFGSVGALDRGKSRHRPRDAKELYGGPYPFIQTGEIANSGGHMTRYNSTYSELGLAQSKSWPKGTLCITIAANIAKTAILDFDACFPDSVVGFLPEDGIKTEYVQAWLGFLQPTLEAIAPQAAQKNINLEILRKLPIPVPPTELQEMFAEHVSDVQGILSQREKSQRGGAALFDALLAQAFNA